MRWTAILAMLVMLLRAAPASAVEPATPEFERTWARTDLPVQADRINRTWMWGPEANTGIMEEAYAESPDGVRKVQYYDKSRMEINDPDAVDDGVWYVTNGRLVWELITGQMQVGADEFVPRESALINVAGDPDDPTGPVYASFTNLLDAPPIADGAVITARFTGRWTVEDDPNTAWYQATAAYHVQGDGIDHQVASPFWSFMNAVGLVYEDGEYRQEPLFVDPFYATGLPITEAYWANVKVNGSYTDVLIQCFERRCLTWTPVNPTGWQVEAGNVGQHYFHWRYPETNPGDYYLASLWQDGLPGSDGTGYEMGMPSGILAGRDGRIYVTDAQASTAQIYRRDGTFVTEFAHPGSEQGDGGLSRPTGIDQDSNGNLYIANETNGDILKFSADGDLLATFQIPGLMFPSDVAIDSEDNVYVLTVATVWKLNTDGEVLDTWIGVGSQLRGIAVDGADIVYVADTLGQRVGAYTSDGTLVNEILTSDITPASAPVDVAVDSAGFLYVLDAGAGTVWVLTQDGGVMRLLEIVPDYQSIGWEDMRIDIDEHDLLWITPMSGIAHYNLYGAPLDAWYDTHRGQLRSVTGLAIAPNGNVIATERYDGWVHVFAPDGSYVTGWGRGALDDIHLYEPSDVVIDQKGQIFVADAGNGRIVRYGPEYGVRTAEWRIVLDPEEQVGAIGLALDDDGNVYVTTVGHVRVYTPEGDLLRTWGWTGSGPGLLGDVLGIAVSGDEVYVVDNTTHRIVVYTRTGNFLREIDGATDSNGNIVVPFTDLREIAVDRIGFLFLIDYAGQQLLKLTPEGVLVTAIAEPGWVNPWSFEVAIDRAGNVYTNYSDGWNSGILRYAPRPSK